MRFQLYRCTFPILLAWIGCGWYFARQLIPLRLEWVIVPISLKWIPFRSVLPILVDAIGYPFPRAFRWNFYWKVYAIPEDRTMSNVSGGYLSIYRVFEDRLSCYHLRRIFWGTYATITILLVLGILDQDIIGWLVIIQISHPLRHLQWACHLL